MHKTNNIITGIASLLLAMIMSSGCLEKEDMAAGMQNVMIELSVSAEPQTKSAPTSMESAINSLRIYAFQGERLAGYAARMNGVSEANSLYMDLELPSSGQQRVDFYVIANEAQMAYENGVVVLSEDMTRAQLEAVKFTGLNSASALPMYGQQSEILDVDKIRTLANDETGHEGHFMLVDPVNILLKRSLAKISIYAAKAEGISTTPQILNATLLADGTRRYSYLFNQSDDVLNAVESRPNDRMISSTRTDVKKSVVPNSAASKDVANFDLIYADTYLPEVTSEIALRVEYTTGQEAEIMNGYVYIPQIIRNTHYKVCILINAEGHLIINYEVAQWTDNLMDDLHFDYPTHSFLREQIATTEQEVALRPSAPATMSEIHPFAGYFQMTYPNNDSWTPTLEGPHAGDCTVEVYEMEGLTAGQTPVTIRPIPASDKWYKIMVKPNPMKMMPGEEVRLAVTYTASGFDTLEYMLINGSYQEYYWPYAGTSQQDANYVIITMVN